MRLMLFTVFLIVNLLGAKDCKAQTGTFIWTNGAPTTNPGASGARFAVDRATFRWYEWVGGTAWVGSGDRIQGITGCSAPNYTPTIHQSWVVINNCDPNPELYAWNGTAWKLVEGGGTVSTDATIAGNGSLGTPLKLAQNGATLGNLLSWNGSSWVNTGDVKLIRNATEQTTLFGDQVLPNITYGNAKAEVVTAIGDNIGQNLTYPFASTIIGANILTGAASSTINSITAIGYQNLIEMEEGENVTTMGTDAGYNLRKGYNSNIIGRHNFFRGDLSATANVYRTNSLGVDVCETCKVVEDATIIGYYPLQTADTVLRSYVQGSEVARNRDEVLNSNLSGYQNSYSPSFSGKTENTESGGYRSLFNTFSTRSMTTHGALSGLIESYNVANITRDGLYLGESSGYNSYGDRSVFAGYRAGAFSSRRKIDGAVAIGYRAGDLWLGNNELAIHNSESSTPLIYGNFATSKLRVNGNFQVSAITTNNANTNVLVRNESTGELELNSAIGANIYTGNGTLLGQRTVEMAGNNLGFNDGSVNFGRTGATAPNARVNIYSTGEGCFVEAGGTGMTLFGTGSAAAANIRNFSTGNGLVCQANNAHAFFATNAGGNNKASFYAENTSNAMRQRTTMLLRSAGDASAGANGDENQLIFADENSSNVPYDGATLKTKIIDASLGRSEFSISSSYVSIASDSVAISSLQGDGNDILFASPSGKVTRSTIDITSVSNTIKASATLDFPSTAVNTNSDLTATVTGATVGDVVSVAPPLAAISAHSCYTAWVSAANTVTVRFNHYGAGGATNPASGVFNIIVTKF